MINVKITEPTGVKLLTKNKYCNDDINVTVDESLLGSGGGGSEEYPSESIAYYKQTRNKNYPYLPLPYEMEETETQDTIYMLYDANGYMCCPAFNITFTSCTCTIQKYMNTTLVSEYTESVTSGTTKYLQFSEEDSDYSTYNYIVIKLQGNITKHYLNYSPQINNVGASSDSSSDLIEVSGKCASCNIKVVGGSTYRYHQKLEHYSFVGVTTTSMKQMFANCFSLKTIPQLDTHLVTEMNYMFDYCYSLQSIPQLDMSSCTSTNGMFEECRSLKTIPQLDTHLVTDMSYMFKYCYSLKTVPQLDMSSCTKMNNMFYYCQSLQTISKLINTGKITDMSSAFYYCYSLQSIPQLDMSSCTSTSSMFYNCLLLLKIGITNAKKSFELNKSSFLSQSELVKILNNLATVETTQTLTLGIVLLPKLTDEQKAIATNKGWTLA